MESLLRLATVHWGHEPIAPMYVTIITLNGPAERWFMESPLDFDAKYWTMDP